MTRPSRPFRHLLPWRRLFAVALLVGLSTTPVAGATAEQEYSAALARERALQGATGPEGLSELRAAMAEYEEIVRRFPGSGYSDNALWQAAGLALVAYERYRELDDLESGRAFLQRLGREYPSSSLVSRVPARLDELSRLLEPIELRRITRVRENDGVKVTIEFDAEVDYLAERLDGPPRLYFDFAGTFTVPPLRNATLDFDDGDLVRQIRLGRHPEQTTRVVLDIADVDSYSFYALHDPYRLVIETVPEASAPVESEAARLEAPVAAEPAVPPASLEELASTRPEEVHRLGLLPVPESWNARRLAPLPPQTPVAQDGPTSGADDPETVDPSVSSPAMHDVLYPGLGGATAGPPSEAPVARAYTSAPLVRRPSLTTPTLRFAKVSAPPPGDDPPSVETTTPVVNATGALSLGRQLGLGVSRVVIDAGHGGYDPGARTANLTESALVLDVAMRLERRLTAAGVEVVQTRRDDVFVPLRARTELANRVGADLLLSIHANAARDAEARGIETYYLDLTTDPTAQMVAARENASSSELMRDLPALVNSIATNNKIDESRDLAELVQRHLVDGVRQVHPEAQDLGVKRAPFVVLIGATMPSVLAEISFLTNAEEAAFLATDAYRDRIADALFRSVVDYQATLKPLGIAADDDN